MWFIYVLYILLFITLNNVNSQSWSSGFRQRDASYGTEWIYMPDGNGVPQVAILKFDENGPRGVLNDAEISYILYTRSGPENGTRLFVNDSTALVNSNFDSARPTKFITHGWKSSATSNGPRNLKDAYLEHGEYNIFLVDWEPLAASTFYLGPMQNTKRVGQDAAAFIDFLVKETNLKTKDVHFIGHSLGAHVAGNAGASTTSGRLGRVTGLDPAMPGFHVFASEKTRLDSSDAIFVDVIHSCGGVLGFLQPLGHADFYPNAGTAVQPGCCCVQEVTEACSHGRSYVYFTESINSRIGFKATKCDTYDNYMKGSCKGSKETFMGEFVERSAEGSYFLRTRSESPYVLLEEVTDNYVWEVNSFE